MIRVTESYKSQTIFAKDMKIGDTGIIADRDTDSGKIVLRGYDCLVCLNEPVSTWDLNNLGQMKVKLCNIELKVL